MKHLSQIFRMQRKLKYRAQALGLNYNCDLILTGYSEAFGQVEDGKLFKYPATIDVTINNRSTAHFSVRTKDGKWINEGSKLNGKGLKWWQVYRLMITELKQHASAIQARKQTNVVAFRGGK